MSASARLARVWTDWWAPAGLLVLCVAPIAGGSARVEELATGAAVTADNARFFASPVPLVVHVVSAVAFCVLGALQFVPALRRRPRRWHRVSGRIALPAGVVAALSGLWMTAFYDLPALDRGLLGAFRFAAGLGMLASLLVSLEAVLRRDFGAHRAWAMRGYALGIGAGTQVLTALPWLLLVGKPVGTTRALLLGAGWAINLAWAEWRIRAKPRDAAPPQRDAHPLAAA